MDISIILAAGKGTRMESDLPKVLHKLNGEELLSYVLKASKGAGFKNNYIIVGYKQEEVKEAFKGEYFIYQPTGDDKPYGTGYAVMQAIPHINDSDNVLILCGDVPLIKSSTLASLLDYYNTDNLDGIILTAIMDDPFGYGRILKDETGNVIKIVEEADATKEEKSIKEINSGTYIFKGKHLKEALNKLTTDNKNNEYYLTDVINIFYENNLKVKTFEISDNNEIIGINSKEDLKNVEKLINDII